MKKALNKQRSAILFYRYAGLLFITILFTATQTQAQVFDEWKGRPNISIKYKFNKNLHIGGTYYLYLDQNVSRFDKSVIAGEIGYKITKWMKAGFDYRYGSGHGEHYNDLRYSLTFDANLSQKWKIKYRPMLQQEFISLDKAILKTNPVEYFLRNRITLSYEPSDKVELYVFTENYIEPTEGEMLFHRQKSALGAEFAVSRRSAIGARFEVINTKKGKIIARPNLSYAYTFGYVKKKK